MTPAARAAAAIAVLDRWIAGEAAEQALTNWGRANRYAGSGDRAAVRDLVFDALRCRRSFAALGGDETGRGLILGGVRAAGLDPEGLFIGGPYGPEPLGPSERVAPEPPDGLVALDCPDWLAQPLQISLGDDFAPVMSLMRHRAPIFLRVNVRRTTMKAAQAALAEDGIEAVPHALAETALEVTGNARRIKASATYLQGLIELQDAASQAVVSALPLRDGQRVLDYCAGGGGKSLAMAAQARVQVTAHDADPARMRDLPERARRAAVAVRLSATADLRRGSFDLVLADAPCSCSGSWRRTPEVKWALTPARLAAFGALQAGILARAALLVAPRGVLAYATCSLLRDENEAQVAAFLGGNPGWVPLYTLRLTPIQGGDGFFVCALTRSNA